MIAWNGLFYIDKIFLPVCTVRSRPDTAELDTNFQRLFLLMKYRRA